MRLASFAALTLLVATVGCSDDKDSVKEPSSVIARGPLTQVRHVADAAKDCGLKDSAIREIGNGRAVLVMGSANSVAAAQCTLQWLGDNRDRLGLDKDVFVGREVAPS